VYGSVNHKISGKLTASAVAQAQFSDFEGGAADGDSELFLLTGVNLSYEINKLAAEVGAASTGFGHFVAQLHEEPDLHRSPRQLLDQKTVEP
jgi:hypothetical protein